jgi:NAD-dependent SIR2 family protein deacetylase
MTLIEFRCDKCKKKIDFNDYEPIKLPQNFNMDLCPKCYTLFLKTIDSWIKEEIK